MQRRQLIVLSGDNLWLEQQIIKISQGYLSEKKGYYFYQKNTEPLFKDKTFHCPFQLAKNTLGQENHWIIFDLRYAFNLDALAIAEGTLKAGGILLIVMNNWQKFPNQLDLDSQRWADGKIILPINFYTYFQNIIEKYQFLKLEQNKGEYVIADHLLKIASNKEKDLTITSDQQQILNKILAKQSDIFIITAKRGRGKSALAGFLAQSLLKENSQQLLVTAPNKKSIQVLQHFSSYDIPFIAPDALLANLEDSSQLIEASYLIIDEAAMIPLPILKKLIGYFKYVICTTTVQSYEGTGRGFLLKFIQNIHRPFIHFELTKSLRWAEDDLLEKFIEDLLLLKESKPNINVINDISSIQLDFYLQSELIKADLLKPFYQLLTLAHYRTSPSDLRRLFDADNDLFFLAKQDSCLIGGIWAILEGSMQDKLLIQEIQRGQRKPRGNLVAQLLTQYTNLDESCLLKSARISRIAVQPCLQGKGIGQKLVQDFCLQLKANTDIDFISVSFGYEEKLMRFWQECGFQVVYLSENQIASSGCYSVVALYGVSEQGNYFQQQAKLLFERNLPLIKHPLKNIFLTNSNNIKIDYKLTLNDIKNLINFAYYHRPLFSTIPSIIRFLKHNKMESFPFLTDYFQPSKSSKKNISYKQWLYLCRQEIKNNLKFF